METVHSLPPNTTQQQDLTTAGQRRVNLIWEYTQAFIAIIVVLANMVTGVAFAIMDKHGDFPPVLMSSLFLIVGFYFSRTNHAAIGGVGPKPIEKYEGR